MNQKVEKYINTISEAKGGKEKLFGIPTDIIGFGEFGKNLALTLEPLVTTKEICFFDLDIQEDDVFHFWGFKDMFKKTEIMIFTKELPEEYLDNLNGLNKSVTIIIDSKFKTNIEKFRDNGFSNNIIII